MARTPMFVAAALLAACGTAEDLPATCDPPLNGCSAFTDLTGGAATIAFGVGGALEYTPACARVKVGQPVTFSGDFGFHPMAQECGPEAAIPPTSSGLSLEVTFDVAGTYSYRCILHHVSGMEGAIDVVP